MNCDKQEFEFYFEISNSNVNFFLLKLIKIENTSRSHTKKSIEALLRDCKRNFK